jgi:hypothetical protein
MQPSHAVPPVRAPRRSKPARKRRFGALWAGRRPRTAALCGVFAVLGAASACTDAQRDAVHEIAQPSGVWDRLAQCESGGNWSINTGNGYSGGLQFLPSTWRAYGGSGQAHHASREAQIRVAERIRADVGYGAWPACSRKLGLR